MVSLSTNYYASFEFRFICESFHVTSSIYFSESDTALVYYSTKEQFEVLLEILDKDYYEKYIYKVLVELQPEILKQMEITAQLTKQFQKERHSVFDAMLGE